MGAALLPADEVFMSLLARRLLLGCLAFLSLHCAPAAPPIEPSTEPAKAVNAPEAKRARYANLVRAARVHGYANPATGEAWMRIVPEGRTTTHSQDGVSAFASALTAPTPGYCVAQEGGGDGMVGSVAGTGFEWFTWGQLDPSEYPPGYTVLNSASSVDGGTCFGHVSDPVKGYPGNESLANFYSNALCFRQRLGNYTGQNDQHVYLDIDRFSGDPQTQSPFGFNPLDYPTADNLIHGADLPALRNRPHHDLGLWDLGILDNGQATDVWFMFRNDSTLSYSWDGYLLVEVYEDCDDVGDEAPDDDDCDGVVNNGCANVLLGGTCYSDDDCASESCIGAVLRSRYGTADDPRDDDIPGACVPQCGNSMIEGSETCDDGNTVAGDGCNEVCALEAADCGTAAIASSYGTYYGDTTGAGFDYDGSCAGGAGEETIVKLVAPETGTVCVDTIGTTWDTQLHVQATCGQAATELACNDDSSGLASMLQLEVTAGATYAIVVDGYGTTSFGPYTLNIAAGACPPRCGDGTCQAENGESCGSCYADCGDCPYCGDGICSAEIGETCSTCTNDCGACPPGDDCAAPQAVTLDFGYGGELAGGGDDHQSSCSAYPGEDRTFAFTPAESGRYCINAQGVFDGDTNLSVRTTCSEPSSELACSTYSPIYATAQVQLAGAASSTYYLVVDTAYGESHAYSLWIERGTCCPDGTIDYGGTGQTCTGFVQVVSGLEHSCGRTSDNRVFCWGDNTYGQLGDSSYNAHAQAVEVSGAFSDWSYLAAGDHYTCGIRNGGRLYCWGRNISGQLGITHRLDTPYPVEVDGSYADWSHVSAGSDHTCGLHIDGSLYCWGVGAAGRLGNGSTGATYYTSPQLIDAGPNWLDVSAGQSHTCGVFADGTLYCWGEGSDGRLGDGNAITSSVPLLAASGSQGWSRVVAGSRHSCGIRNGHAYCWGAGQIGQLGLGAAISTQPVPTEVSGGASDWSELSTRGNLTCGRRDSALYCWGSNALGQLGIGSSTPQVAPALVGAGGWWQSVGAGAQHACGVLEGAIACWGSNLQGQLGDGTVATRRVPTEVAGKHSDWQGVTAGGAFTCGARNGRIFCWGSNASGQLGIGASSALISTALVPSEVYEAHNTWMYGSAGNAHFCGVRDTGRLFCWGAGADGRLGVGDFADYDYPVEVDGFATDWVDAAAGAQHSCGLRSTGVAYCWGRNVEGQLGDASNLGSTLPVAVDGGFSDWSSIVTGAHHTCGLRAGRLYCWGRNTDGQLGVGGFSDSSSPLEVAGAFSDWMTVSAGVSHTCGRRNGNHLYCWGNNANGQLGDGSQTTRDTPVEVVGNYNDWQDAALGAGFSCARRNTGHLYCWGNNDFGQLGDGSTSMRTTPTEIVGNLDGWGSPALGTAHTCAQRGGRQYCWGRYSVGELGYLPPWTPQPLVSP